MRHVLLLSLLLLSVSACSSSSNDVDLSANQNIHDAIDAATGPLQDLNLRRTDIPPLLLKAEQAPYAHADKIRCSDVQGEVAELDKLLGPDVKSTNDGLTLASADGDLMDNISRLSDAKMPSGEDVVSGASDLAHDGIMGFIHSQTSFIPFRSIVRKITGAESHQKHLEAAYQAGKLRRAYLKGLAEDRFGPKCLMHPIMVETTPAAVVAKADVVPPATDAASATPRMGIQH